MKSKQRNTRSVRKIAAQGCTLFALGAIGLCAALPASAQVLDEFVAPLTSAARVVQGTSETTIYESGLPIVGGARDTRLYVYGNLLNSASVLSVGEGRVSTAQGTGAKAETTIAYGAFTRVGGNQQIGGPLLGLDLTKNKNMKLVFSGAEDGLNINVTYYTSAPLSACCYYIGAGVNVDPSSSGAPLSVVVPIPDNPSFNWKKVDGVVVLINRSGPTPHTSYTLDRLEFVP